MTMSSIASALSAHRSGSGWMASCPAHDDNTPSLSLREVCGKLLVHCHAGCEQFDVIDALKAKGLWAERDSGQRPRIIAAYDYTDPAGQLLYQVVRTQPKGFFQRSPDGLGGWINRKSKRQVLFHLREVAKAAIVFVVEGEKDVETLQSHGFVATTNAGGANAPWLSEFTETLAGREVILIPDNDKPGRERVALIARALVGHVARLVILELDDGKDVTEWFEKRHSELELIELAEEGLAPNHD